MDKTKPIGDYLKAMTRSGLEAVLKEKNDTEVLFSDIILKVNRKNKVQERVFILTSQAIYNIEPGSNKLKRRIPLTSLGSVSMSKLNDNWFALHVPSEYDYLMISSKKTEIVTALQSAWNKVKSKDLTVNLSNKFTYKIDTTTIREIQFTRVDNGVTTQIFTKASKK